MDSSSIQMHQSRNAPALPGLARSSSSLACSIIANLPGIILIGILLYFRSSFHWALRHISFEASIWFDFEASIWSVWKHRYDQEQPIFFEGQPFQDAKGGSRHWNLKNHKTIKTLKHQQIIFWPIIALCCCPFLPYTHCKKKGHQLS